MPKFTFNTDNNNGSLSNILTELKSINKSSEYSASALSELLKGSKGVTTSAFNQDAEKFSDSFVSSSLQYYDKSVNLSSDQSEKLTDIVALLKDSWRIMNKQLETFSEGESDQDKEDKEETKKSLDSMDKSLKMISDINAREYRDSAKSDMVRNRMIMRNLTTVLEGIWTNTAVPIFQQLTDGLKNTAIQIYESSKSLTIDSLKSRGLTNVNQNDIEKLMSIVTKTRGQVSLDQLTAASSIGIDAGLMPSQLLSTNVKTSSGDKPLVEMIARFIGLGMEEYLDSDQLSNAVKKGTLDSYIESLLVTRNLHTAGLSKSTISRTESALSRFSFEGDKDPIRAQSRAKAKLGVLYGGQTTQGQEAADKFIEYILRASSMGTDTDKLLSLSALTDDKTARKIIEFNKRPDAGSNQGELLDIILGAAPSMSSKFKNTDLVTKSIIASGMNISEEDLSIMSRFDTNQKFSNDLLSKILDTNESSAEVLATTAAVAEKNGGKQLSMMHKILELPIIGDGLKAYGKLLADPTLGPAASIITAYAGVNAVKVGGGLLRGIGGKLLGGIAGSAGTGALASTTGATVGAAGAGGAGLSALAPIGLGLAGVTMLGSDAFSGSKKSKDWLGNTDMQSTIISGIGGALGGSKGGVGGALKGAAKGALIGSFAGPIGAAIGGAAGTVLGAVGSENISKGLNWFVDGTRDVFSFIDQNQSQYLELLKITGKLIFFDQPLAAFTTIGKMMKFALVEQPFNTFKIIENTLKLAGTWIGVSIKSVIGSTIAGAMNLLDPVISKIPGIGKLWSTAKSSVGTIFDTTEERKNMEVYGKLVGEYALKTVDSAKGTVSGYGDLYNNLSSDLSQVKFTKLDQSKKRLGRVVATSNPTTIIPVSNGTEYSPQQMENNDITSNNLSTYNNKLTESSNKLSTNYYQTSTKQGDSMVNLLKSMSDTLARTQSTLIDIRNNTMNPIMGGVTGGFTTDSSNQGLPSSGAARLLNWQ